MNIHRLVTSANWVRNELLIRLAHRIRAFQQLPFIVGSNPHLEKVYAHYWRTFEGLRKFPIIHTEQDNIKFCQFLSGMEDNSAYLTRGLVESAMYYPPDQHDLDLFLNRVLRSRISRRILAEQHLALTEACENQSNHTLGYGDGYVGIILMHCSALEMVNKAKWLVYQHLEKNQQFSRPEIEVVQNREEGEEEIVFAYIPEQLEHILYDLLHNAVRFSIKKYSGTSCPPIKVTVSANSSDIYFRISDQGGGMTRDSYERLWSYQARACVGDFKHFENIPATIEDKAKWGRHLGIGLTLSRIYAEYWGGELQVITMDGYGTDVYVRIPRLGTSTENLGIEHPMFHHTTSKPGNHTLVLKDRNQDIKPQPVNKAQQELVDTSLTSKDFSGSSWSQSCMIQS